MTTTTKTATAGAESISERLARFNGKPDHGDECQCAECAEHDTGLREGEQRERRLIAYCADDDGDVYIGDDDGDLIVAEKCLPEYADDLTRRYNTHAALVRALEQALNVLYPDDPATSKAIDMIQEALRQARGGE